MKAMLRTGYGSPDALQLKELEKPTPTDHQVLIKVHAASINAYDGHFLRGPFLLRISGAGLRKPKDPRLGVDLAGRVEAVGSKVTQFKVGDEVFGEGEGAFAEYACAPEDALIVKPSTMTFEEAAALPMAAVTALQGLRDSGQLQAGQKVLIYGASGGVGSFAVQLGRYLGAEVTAVCSPKNVEMVRSLGADQVIDYTKEDVTRKRQRYDLILGVNGYHSLFAYSRILTPKGRYVMIGASKKRLIGALLQSMVLGPMLSKISSQHMSIASTHMTQTDLTLVKELVEEGLVVPVIDTCYPLAEAAAAFRYVNDVHARGKVVITME
jgi:NADPH:quinone reductase-like Zn-dependent oxidoreductase